MQENLREQVAIDFGFTSDWLRKWREIFKVSPNSLNIPIFDIQSQLHQLSQGKTFSTGLQSLNQWTNFGGFNIKIFYYGNVKKGQTDPFFNLLRQITSKLVSENFLILYIFV